MTEDYFAFPGRSEGTETCPLPSRYPTLGTVLEVVSEVMVSYASECDLYKRSRKYLRSGSCGLRKLVVGGGRYGQAVVDTRKVVVVIAMNNIRWVKAHDRPPQPYSSKHIASVLGCSANGVWRLLHEGCDKLEHDECLRSLYFRSLDELSKTHLLHYPLQLRA